MAGDPFQRYTESDRGWPAAAAARRVPHQPREFQDAYEAAAELEDQQADLPGPLQPEHGAPVSGEIREAEKGLREILLKTEDPQCIFVASSNLASSLRRQGRLERRSSTPKRALRACEGLDNYAWKATSTT